MPSGWWHGLYDRGLYIVQSGAKEKREGGIRLWRSFDDLITVVKGAWALLWPVQIPIFLGESILFFVGALQPGRFGWI